MPEIIEGKVRENPYGNWSDVDTGLYVGGKQLFPWGMYPEPNFLDEYVGKNVRITIEVIEEPEKPSEDE